MSTPAQSQPDVNPSQQPVEHGKFGELEVRREFHGTHGHHRATVMTPKGLFTGTLVNYTEVSTVVYEGRKFATTTDHFDSILPDVFEIVEADDKPEDKC